mgnify:CR=1 FL=1
MSKKLNLTQGRVAIVDDDDFEWLSRSKWYYMSTGYAAKKFSGRNFYMHWTVIGRPLKGMVTDHINGNGLDNRKSNLRTVSQSENLKNSKLRKDNTSGFKGVSQMKKTGRWRARIQIEHKQTHLGSFKTAEEAHRAFRKACIQYYGEFARLN